MKRKSGLADSPFFNHINAVTTPSGDVFPTPHQFVEVEKERTKSETEVNTEHARNQAIGQLGLPERPNAGMTESRQSGKTENATNQNVEILNAETMAKSVGSALKTKAAKKESFRFPLELIEELTDIPHEVRKAYKKPLSKTTIYVAALTAYLWDFRKNGKDSLFYKHLIEEQP